MRRLRVQPLTPERIPQAFVLIQVSIPEVQLEDWVAFAAHLASAEHVDKGALIALNEQGYIVGLCCYHLEDTLRHGRTLNVDHFLALDLFDLTSVALTLAESAHSLAQELGCCAIYTCLERGAGATNHCWLHEVLAIGGYEMKAYQMCKPIAPEASARVASQYSDPEPASI